MDGSFRSSSGAGLTGDIPSIRGMTIPFSIFQGLLGWQRTSAVPARRNSTVSGILLLTDRRKGIAEHGVGGWKNTFRLAQESELVTDVTPSETTMNPCDSPIDLDCFQNGRGERIRTSDPLVPNSKGENFKCFAWCCLAACGASPDTFPQELSGMHKSHS
jgi:hypothetical protein